MALNLSSVLSGIGSVAGGLLGTSSLGAVAGGLMGAVSGGAGGAAGGAVGGQVIASGRRYLLVSKGGKNILIQRARRRRYYSRSRGSRMDKLLEMAMISHMMAK